MEGEEPIPLAASRRLRPLEIASGSIRGVDEASSFPNVVPLASTRAAFEHVVLEALRHPPCVVSFSGGRDSSAVLAVAVDVARREGLPLPVPITLSFPGDPAADEDSWQDLVLRHLAIDHRVVLPFADELSLLGPFAQEALRAYGPLFPANSYAHLAVADHARGGTVLTGFGGDETMSTSPLCQRVNRVLVGQVRPEPRDVLRAAGFFGPKSTRRVALRRHVPDPAPVPWLRPRASRKVTRESGDDLTSEPLRWDHWGEWWWCTRYRSMVQYSLDRVAALRNATICSPFAHPLVIRSAGHEWGRVGIPSRTGAMQHLVGDLLPAELTARHTKAAFSSPFAGPGVRSFAEHWDGSGVDTDLVDVGVLRRLWTGDGYAPDFRSSLLLQTAWLADVASYE